MDCDRTGTWGESRRVALAATLVSGIAVATIATVGACHTPTVEATTTTTATANTAKTAATAETTAQAPEFKPYTQVIPGTNVSFEMVPIPGGKFMMGSPATEKGRKDDEGPQIEVEIEPFWMGKYEVTWDEYDEFAKMYGLLKELKQSDLREIPPGREADAVSYPTPLFPQEAVPIIMRMGREGGYPAASMTQLAAKMYTKWLSKKTGHFYRLPTEAEWEYACRAGSTTAYHFGDDPDDLEEYAWYFDNSELDDGLGAYRKVGQKKPNAWGLYDMHGNVAEWTLDQYIPDHYKKFEGRTVSWREVIAWPTQEHPRVVRGGGWDSDAPDLRAARRIGSQFPQWSLRDPQLPKSLWWHTETFWVGFRVVRPLNEPSEEEKLKYWDPDVDRILEILEQQRDRQIRALVEHTEREADPAEKK